MLISKYLSSLVMIVLEGKVECTLKLSLCFRCSNSSIGKFCSCSNLSMPKKFYSLDNCMTLIFTSDNSKSAKGFEAEYTSIDNSTELDPQSNCRFVSCSQACRKCIVFGVLLTTSSNLEECSRNS